MAEYIEREALYEKAYWHGEHPDVSNPFPDGVDAIDIKDVDAIPTADVAPVVHGRWIHYPDCGVTRCSHCGWSIEECWESKRCPDCGAKMDGGDNDEVD